MEAKGNNRWNEHLQFAICENCDWRYGLSPGTPTEGIICPHCRARELTIGDEARPQVDLHPPELVVPFSIPETGLQHNLQAFAQGIRFAPPDLNVETLRRRLQYLYMPMWLVDTEVRATWQAEAGYDYEVVSHQSKFDDFGGWKTREVNETRTRWEPRLGRLERVYENTPAPALEDDTELRVDLGIFELAEVQPFQVEDLERVFLRLPNRSTTDAWPTAVPAVQARAAEECRQAMNADRIRQFRWTADYHQQIWTLLLQPVLTTFYLDDDQKPRRLLIHGQTGRVSGPRRASMRRARRTTTVILAVAAVILLLSLFAGAAGVLVPALLVPAGVGVFLSALIGLLAGVPMLMVWQFNRNQAREERK